MIEFIPTNCYECGEPLKVTVGKNGKYKLMCVNTDCGGIAVRKFQKGMLAFEIAGIGPANFKSLYNAGIRDIVGLLTVTSEELVASGEFKEGRALDKLMEAIKSVETVKFSALIESLQFDNVGNTISKEIEKYYAGLDYSFSGFDYSVREQIEDINSDMNKKIKEMIDAFCEMKTVRLVLPKKPLTVETSVKTRVMEMTGSPKDFGFATKSDFEKAVAPYGVVAGSLNKDCSFLVTDDMSSTSSKMVKAGKLGVQIVTYGQLIEMLKNE
jgi:DNA ligase (NAD+)